MEQVISQEIPTINRAAKRRKDIAFLCVKYFFLVFFSFLFIFPMYVLVINSFMPNEQIMGQRSLWPSYFYFGTYNKVFTSEYFRYLMNTLTVCVLNVGGVCVASSITAYAIAKMNFYGKNFVFACIMGIVLLPSTVISIPLYIIYSKLNWIGTLYPLWVPMWFGGGTMNIFLVRQFMRGVPKSYSEAASIDGAMLLNFIAKPNFIAYNKICRNCLPVKITTGFFRAPKFVWTTRCEDEIAAAHRNGEYPIFEKLD